MDENLSFTISPDLSVILLIICESAFVEMFNNKKQKINVIYIYIYIYIMRDACQPYVYTSVLSASDVLVVETSPLPLSRR